MGSLKTILAKLGEEIQDVNEETFDLFSQSLPSRDLGMIDPKQEQIEVSIAGRDFSITQSPGLLQSQRGGGTTGAAVWQVTVRCAEWLASADNALFATGALTSESTVLELGAGIAGIVPSILSKRVRRVVATDQAYVLKALRDNIHANRLHKKSIKARTTRDDANIDVLPLDWENDDVSGFLRSNELRDGVDMIIACDCVYNYALISPLVQTSVEICRARHAHEDHSVKPTICVVVQQLRQPEVFEEWLDAFHQSFRVWRVPDDLISRDLGQNSGYVVHLGVLHIGEG